MKQFVDDVYGQTFDRFTLSAVQIYFSKSNYFSGAQFKLTKVQAWRQGGAKGAAAPPPKWEKF